MSVIEIVIFLIVGALCAAIASALIGVSPGGILGAIVIGFLGAFVGTWLAGKLGLPELFVFRYEDAAVPIVWTIVGSFLLLAIVGLFRRAAR
jgi:uncharacterized membrane protein YeaQ/YmgE (transglycosylase-associated protein family)